MAGYSGTPLPQKLGIKPHHRVVALSAPDGFLPGVEWGARLGNADLVVAFVTSRAKLNAGFPKWAAAIPKDGAVWVAWPRKASKVPTDVTEDVVRELALSTGLVDNKVCAIDDTWSGLRLVYRLKDR